MDLFLLFYDEVKHLLPGPRAKELCENEREMEKESPKTSSIFIQIMSLFFFSVMSSRVSLINSFFLQIRMQVLFLVWNSDDAEHCFVSFPSTFDFQQVFFCVFGVFYENKRPTLTISSIF